MMAQPTLESARSRSGLLGTNCRGGPPWPPVALIKFLKIEAVDT